MSAVHITYTFINSTQVKHLTTAKYLQFSTLGHTSPWVTKHSQNIHEMMSQVCLVVLYNCNQMSMLTAVALKLYLFYIWTIEKSLFPTHSKSYHKPVCKSAIQYIYDTPRLFPCFPFDVLVRYTVFILGFPYIASPRYIQVWFTVTFRDCEQYGVKTGTASIKTACLVAKRHLTHWNIKQSNLKCFGCPGALWHPFALLWSNCLLTGQFHHSEVCISLVWLNHQLGPGIVKLDVFRAAVCDACDQFVIKCIFPILDIILNIYKQSNSKWCTEVFHMDREFVESLQVNSCSRNIVKLT